MKANQVIFADALICSLSSSVRMVSNLFTASSIVLGCSIMFLKFMLLILVSFSINAAEKDYGNVMVKEVTSIYDADTFRVNIEGWPDIVGKHVSIRVLGIDAPELRGKCESEKINVCLADSLISTGLARPYAGGTRQGWCPASLSDNSNLGK